MNDSDTTKPELNLAAILLQTKWWRSYLDIGAGEWLKVRNLSSNYKVQVLSYLVREDSANLQTPLARALLKALAKNAGLGKEPLVDWHKAMGAAHDMGYLGGLGAARDYVGEPFMVDMTARDRLQHLVVEYRKDLIADGVPGVV